MKVGQKLILGFLAVIVLTAILGVVTIRGINDIRVKTETHHNTPLMAAIANMRVDVEELVRATEGYDADWITEEEASEEIEELKAQIGTYLEDIFAASAKGLLPSNEAESLKGSVDALYDLSAKIFLLHGKTRAEIAPVMAEFDERVEEIDVTLDAMLGKIEELSRASADSILSTVASNKTVAIVVLVAVILAALGVSFAIARSIAGPVAKLRDVAIEIGKGDLTRRAEVKSKDEIGELAGSFNQMTEQIQRRDEELRAVNKDLRASEEELKASNEELQAANEELREAQEKLVRTERLAAIGQLAGGVGHELRNPLGAIKNAVYYIKGKVARSELAQQEPRVMEFLSLVDDEIASSNKIINDLLGFSRVGKPAVSPSRIEKVIDDALVHVAISENIELVKNLDANLPAIELDADQIRQVLTNIADNAVKAMPDGGRLIISARASDKFMEVGIADSGIGIPEESLGKIFEPLYTTRAKGIGLGLAVCKAIIDRHGGHIEVKSKVGEGTSFTIKLPLRAE